MNTLYTFKPGDYIKFMNPLTTDRGADQHYKCPICGLKVRSTWGHADNHWQSHLCPHCNGEGWGIAGVNWEWDDPINKPYDNEVERCPFCLGSSKTKEGTVNTALLTSKEKHLLDELATIWNKFLVLLPYHPTREIQDFQATIRTAQQIILTRPGRRQLVDESAIIPTPTPEELKRLAVSSEKSHGFTTEPL